MLGITLTNDEVELLPRDYPLGSDYSTSIDGQSFNVDYVLAYPYVARSIMGRVDPMALVEDQVACDGNDDSCLDEFVTTLGRRLYRRPLSNDEHGELIGLAATIEGLDGAGRRDAIVGITETMLQAPAFIYRVEDEGGPGDDPQRVGGYELASRLSFFLWQSAPDDALLTQRAVLGP